MTLYSQFLYPPRELKKPDPIDQLRKLKEAIDKAKDQIAHFETLNTYNILDPRRLYWKQSEINHGIVHWRKTLGNLEGCWNGMLNKMMI